MALVVLVALVMAAIPATVSAQQPAPAPAPQPPPGVDTPEAEASRDLERIGETATREKACKRLEDLRDNLFRVVTRDRERLRRAVRYYARAHGLTTNIDELIEELTIRDSLTRTNPELKGPEEETEKEAAKRWGNCSADFWFAVRLLLEAQSAPAPPRSVGAADPPSDRSGGKKWLFLGLGAAAVGGTAIYILPKDDPPVPAAAPTPAPPLTPFNPAGPYDVTLTVLSDPGGNAPRIGMEPSLLLVFTVAGSTLQYTCPVGSHINPGGGPVDLTTGAFNAAGSGPFAGRNGVQFLFPGTFGRDGTITGEYRVGTAGELGQVTAYGVNGRKRP